MSVPLFCVAKSFKKSKKLLTKDVFFCLLLPHEECKFEWIKSTCYYRSIHSGFTASRKCTHAVSWPALVPQSFMNIYRSRDRRGSILTSFLDRVDRIKDPASALCINIAPRGNPCAMHLLVSFSLPRGLLSEFRELAICRDSGSH